MFFDIVDMTMTYIQYLLLLIRIDPNAFSGFYLDTINYFMALALNLLPASENEQKLRGYIFVDVPIWLPFDIRLEFSIIVIVLPLTLSTVCLLSLYSKLSYVWYLMLLIGVFIFVFGSLLSANPKTINNWDEESFLSANRLLSNSTSVPEDPSFQVRVILTITGLVMSVILIILVFPFRHVQRVRQRRRRKILSYFESKEVEMTGYAAIRKENVSDNVLTEQSPSPLPGMKLQKKQQHSELDKETNIVLLDSKTFAAQQMRKWKREVTLAYPNYLDMAQQLIFFIVLFFGGLFFLGIFRSQGVGNKFNSNIVFSVLGLILLILSGLSMAWGLLWLFRAGRTFRLKVSDFCIPLLLGAIMIFTSLLYIGIIIDFIGILYCTTLTCASGTRFSNPRSHFPFFTSTNGSLMKLSQDVCILCNAHDFEQRSPSDWIQNVCYSKKNQSRLFHDARVRCQDVDPLFRVSAGIMFTLYFLYLPVMQFYLARYSVNTLKNEFPVESRFVKALSDKQLFQEKLKTSCAQAAFIYRACKPQYRYYSLSFLLQKIILTLTFCITRYGVGKLRTGIGIGLFIVVPLIAMGCSIRFQPFLRPTEAIYFPIIQFLVAFAAMLMLADRVVGPFSITTAYILTSIEIAAPFFTLIFATIFSLRNDRSRYERLHELLQERFRSSKRYFSTATTEQDNGDIEAGRKQNWDDARKSEDKHFMQHRDPDKVDHTVAADYDLGSVVVKVNRGALHSSHKQLTWCRDESRAENDSSSGPHTKPLNRTETNPACSILSLLPSAEYYPLRMFHFVPRLYFRKRKSHSHYQRNRKNGPDWSVSDLIFYHNRNENSLRLLAPSFRPQSHLQVQQKESLMGKSASAVSASKKNSADFFDVHTDLNLSLWSWNSKEKQLFSENSHAAVGPEAKKTLPTGFPLVSILHQRGRVQKKEQGLGSSRPVMSAEETGDHKEATAGQDSGKTKDFIHFTMYTLLWKPIRAFRYALHYMSSILAITTKNVNNLHHKDAALKEWLQNHFGIHILTYNIVLRQRFEDKTLTPALNNASLQKKELCANLNGRLNTADEEVRREALLMPNPLQCDVNYQDVDSPCRNFIFNTPATPCDILTDTMISAVCVQGHISPWFLYCETEPLIPPLSLTMNLKGVDTTRLDATYCNNLECTAEMLSTSCARHQKMNAHADAGGRNDTLELTCPLSDTLWSMPSFIQSIESGSPSQTHLFSDTEFPRVKMTADYVECKAAHPRWLKEAKTRLIEMQRNLPVHPKTQEQRESAGGLGEGKGCALFGREEQKSVSLAPADKDSSSYAYVSEMFQGLLRVRLQNFMDTAQLKSFEDTLCFEAPNESHGDNESAALVPKKCNASTIHALLKDTTYPMNELVKKENGEILAPQEGKPNFGIGKEEPVCSVYNSSPQYLPCSANVAGDYPSASHIMELRYCCLQRQIARDKFYESKKQLAAAQSTTDEKIDATTSKILIYLFMILGIAASLSLALVIGGMLRTIDQTYLDGTQYKLSNNQLYALAGYSSWSEFTQHCVCTATNNAFPSFPFYITDVEEWICMNGIVKERVRRSRHTNMFGIFYDGYAIRSLCGMDFLNGCHAVSKKLENGSEVIDIRDCNIPLSREELLRW